MDTADRILKDVLATMAGDFKHVDSPHRDLPPLRNLAACYRKALKDEQTKMPPYLHAAMLQVIALIDPVGASPYAERRTQHRDGGGDMSAASGMPLRPGT